MVDACGVTPCRGSIIPVALWLLAGASVRSAWRSKPLVDGIASVDKLNDEFAGGVVAKDRTVLAYPQTPETGESIAQSTYVALSSVVQIIERSPDVSSHARMQFLECGDNLVREFHAGMVAASW